MKKRILVVEDQADIRKLIRTTLEFEYYEIYEASDAAEALEAVKRLHPQLLLLDIMMPGGMNGLELCRLIKSDPSLGSPQVVMLSALSSSHAIQAGINAGADAYLIKPFSPRQLIVYVDSLGSQFSETD